jgi:hypothetical protein
MPYTIEYGHLSHVTRYSGLDSRQAVFRSNKLRERGLLFLILDDEGVPIDPYILERLADEHDAAQERGEVPTRANNQHASSGTEEALSVADIGLNHKHIHETRMVRQG